jgi:2-keto-myo-inositol isomerase
VEPFRYSLNTSTLRGHRLPLVEELEIAAEAGYQGVEPWIDELDRYVAEGGSLIELGVRIQDLGLRVENAIGFFEWIVDDPQRRQAGLNEAKRNMDMVAQLGGRRLAAPPFGATEQTDLNLLAAAERYHSLLELGDQTGVTPVLEVWGFSRTLSRLGEAVLVATESGHPDACLLLDVYHLYKGGSGIAGLPLLRGSGIAIFHVNDYPAGFERNAITDADRVYPGDGIAPLADLVRTLREIDYAGPLSLELFNKDYYAQDPRVVARTGLAKMRAAFQGAADEW